MVVELTQQLLSLMISYLTSNVLEVFDNFVVYMRAPPNEK